MKLKLTTYFFVLLYLIAMLRPIAPFVEYAINYDYIAKVLCINKDKPELSCKGKCQLMKKLKQQQEDDFNSLRIAMEEYPIGFVSVLEVKKRDDYQQKQKANFGYHKNYKFLYYPSVFHPPTA
ncbi:hypothetical protein [uncultured Tenacibaculum sp.]|uniref:hypothetical protein n=1 Tax=uncultured Tenacibaculum sp. TaxID=174713 RepID=UPI002608362C|nr:hypothetical protein [uncultured Tenacibaculum sp.]